MPSRGIECVSKPVPPISETFSSIVIRATRWATLLSRSDDAETACARAAVEMMHNKTLRSS